MPAKVQEIETKTVAHLFAPWAQLQSLFNFTNLPFDLDFDKELSLATAKIENNLNRHQTSSPATLSKNEQIKAKDDSPAVNSETKATQAPVQEQKIIQLIDPTQFVMGNLEILFPFSQPEIQGSGGLKLNLDFLVDKIIEQIKLVKEKGQVELQFSLQPKELGEIWLSVSMKNGLVSISMAASPETKKILENDLGELEAALKKERLNIGDLRVTEVTEFSRERRSA